MKMQELSLEEMTSINGGLLGGLKLTLNPLGQKVKLNVNLDSLLGSVGGGDLGGGLGDLGGLGSLLTGLLGGLNVG